jgi:TolA-binding protein
MVILFLENNDSINFNHKGHFLHFMRCSRVIIALFLLSGLPGVLPAADSPGRDEYLYAKKLFEERYYDLAADQLERCLRDYPALDQADEAQFLLGEAYLRNNDPDRARAAFLRTAIVYPESPRAPEALYKVGESLEASGRQKEAGQAYERVQGFYAGSTLAPKALSRAAKLFATTGDSLHAADITSILIEKYPDSPYASISRLDLADRLYSRNDLTGSAQFLNWVATRSGSDSLASEAWLRLGRLQNKRFDLQSARENYNICMERYPTQPAAFQSRVELAKIENMRGSMPEAVELALPLLSSTTPKWRQQGCIVSGDAAYLNSDYETALAWYDSAGNQSPEAMLKAAWTAELLSRRKSALDRYIKLTGNSSEIGFSARMRAAILSFDLGQPDKAAALWLRLLDDRAYTDTSGRVLLELTRARAEARLDGVSAAADSIQYRNPSSPYLDDALFVAGRAAFRKGDYTGAVERYESLLRLCPASDLRDTARTGIEFIRNFHLRGEQLIERMAELSSLPQNRTNPVRWALDWGDFYLDEFKDPVKAADQYDRVLDDILATTEDRLYALRKSGIAYQLLAESARREKDSFSWTMYSDSAHSRMIALQRLDPTGPHTLRLALRLIDFDARLARSGQAAPGVIAKRCEELFSLFPEDSIPATTVVTYLHSMTQANRVDMNSAPILSAIAERGLSRSIDDQTRAELKDWECSALLVQKQFQAAIDTAKVLLAAYPMTVPAAERTLWLGGNGMLTPEERLKFIQQYRALYPYRVEEDKVGLLEAEVLDLLDRPIDALAARQRADLSAGWGRPRIDLLDYPPPQIRLEYASAYRRAGQYAQAAEELAIVLNSASSREIITAALHEMVEVERGRRNPQGALLLLDSLSLQDPVSSQALYGERLRPLLLMDLGKYNEAEAAYSILSASNTDPDSLFLYTVQKIICQYRQGSLEEAKKSSGELMKRFKDRKDLDPVKALFTLEKGRALDKTKKTVEARENFAIVREKYPLTQWADDAAYANAKSFFNEGKYDEAVKQLERFISDYPDSLLALEASLNLGMAQYQLEKYSEAVASLKRVWDSKRAEHLWQSAFESLSSVYRNLRFFDAAIRLNRDYLGRFPDAPDALDRKMDIAQFYIELKEWDEGIRQYRPLLPFADAEREAEIQYYIGEAYLGKGDFRSAILEFLKVKILGRKTKLDWGVTAIYQAGFCYEKLGDFEGAHRMYKKIIEETGETSNYGRAARQKLESLPAAPPPQTPSPSSSGGG